MPAGRLIFGFLKDYEIRGINFADAKTSRSHSLTEANLPIFRLENESNLAARRGVIIFPLCCRMMHCRSVTDCYRTLDARLPSPVLEEVE